MVFDTTLLLFGILPGLVIGLVLGWLLGGTDRAGRRQALAERGLIVSYESIRRWVLAFGPAITRRLPSSWRCSSTPMPS